MLKKFVVAILSLCFFLVILPITNIPSTTKVSAGMSQKIFSDEKTLFKDDKINNYNFKVGKGIVADKVSKKNVVRFLETAGNKDILLSYQFPTLTELEGNVESLYISTKINVEEFKGKKEFGLIVGAQRLDAYPKSPDSAWLYFRENESKTGYEYGFDMYSASKEKTVLIAPTDITSVMNIKIIIKQYFNKDIFIKINEAEYNIDNVKAGHVGIGQSGNFTDKNNYVKSYISDFEIINKFYSRPENTNLFADFNSGYVNNEQWLVRKQLCINNGILEFRNANHDAFISTRHKFSNFQMTFDITDIDRKPDYDDYGKLKQYPSVYFWIVYGLDADSSESLGGYGSAVGYPESCGFRIYSDVNPKTDYCDKGTFVRHGPYNRLPYKNASFTDKYDLWNPYFDGRVANIRVTVKDSISKLEIKWADEEEYALIVEENLGYTPQGYVMISAGWNSQYYNTNISIDNLKIINLDKDPVFTETGFSKNGLENNGDYEYTDTRNPAYMFGYDSGINSGAQPVFQIVLTSVFFALTIAGVVAIIVILVGRRKIK